jgi:hypothetical protein
MMKRLLKTPAGETEIVFPEPGDFASFFLFAMHKSGSTLMYSMMKAALPAAGVPVIDLPLAAFKNGLPGNKVLNPRELIMERGYCYCGFRNFPKYLRKFDLTKNKKILLVRDPRDMLVSFYFSMANSHNLPKTGVVRDAMLTSRTDAKNSDIDEYCLEKVIKFKTEFSGYRHFSESEIWVIRYEDVVFRKLEWLTEMLAYFSISVDPDKLKAIAEKHDVRPDAERPDMHIRQVVPGNFRKHLSAATIEKLNSEFAVEMRQYGYEP